MFIKLIAGDDIRNFNILQMLQFTKEHPIEMEVLNKNRNLIIQLNDKLHELGKKKIELFRDHGILKEEIRNLNVKIAELEGKNEIQLLDYFSHGVSFIHYYIDHMLPSNTAEYCEILEKQYHYIEEAQKSIEELNKSIAIEWEKVCKSLDLYESKLAILKELEIKTSEKLK